MEISGKAEKVPEPSQKKLSSFKGTTHIILFILLLIFSLIDFQQIHLKFYLRFFIKKKKFAKHVIVISREHLLLITKIVLRSNVRSNRLNITHVILCVHAHFICYSDVLLQQFCVNRIQSVVASTGFETYRDRECSNDWICSNDITGTHWHGVATKQSREGRNLNLSCLLLK